MTARSGVLILRPPAKINLSLRVGPRRADGFHDVRTVLQSIALHDRLAVSARRGPFALVARSADVPVGPDNLVWRAAERLWRALGRTGEPRDACIELEKSIPVAAGLGGGSADAAAALVGLNVVWRSGRSRRDLARLAADLGSDVPFFLVAGTALGAARGDELYPLDDIPRLHLVLVTPSSGVTAADAYGWLDEDRARGVGDDLTADGADLDVGWPSPLALVNDLQGPVVRRHPVVGEMLEALRRAGARAALMAGSGSSAFGVFSAASARRAARRLGGCGWQVRLTRTLSRREAGRLMGPVRGRMLNS